MKCCCSRMIFYAICKQWGFQIQESIQIPDFRDDNTGPIEHRCVWMGPWILGARHSSHKSQWRAALGRGERGSSAAGPLLGHLNSNPGWQCATAQQHLRRGASFFLSPPVLIEDPLDCRGRHCSLRVGWRRSKPNFLLHASALFSVIVLQLALTNIWWHSIFFLY